MSKIKISDLNFPTFNRVTDNDLLIVVDAETNETKKATKKQLLEGIATLGNISEIVDYDYINDRYVIPSEKFEQVVDSDYVQSRIDQDLLDSATREFVDSNYVNALINSNTIKNIIDPDYVATHSALQTEDIVNLVDSDYVSQRESIETGKKLFTAAEPINAGDVVSLDSQGFVRNPIITQISPNFSDTLTRTGSDGFNLKVAFINDAQGSLLFLHKENEDYKITAGKVTTQGLLELGTNTITLSTGEYSFDWDIAADTKNGNHFIAVGDNGDGEGVVIKSGTVDANLNISISDTFTENSLSSRFNKIAYDESSENYLWVGTDVFGSAIINVNPNTKEITFGQREDLSSVLPNTLLYNLEHDLIYVPHRNKFIAAFSTTGASAEIFTVTLTLSGGTVVVSDKTVIDSRANGDYKDVRLFSAPFSTYLQYSYRENNTVYTSFLELIPDNSSYEITAGTIQTLPSNVKNATWQYDEANSVFFYYAIVGNNAVYSIYTKKNGLLTKAMSDVNLTMIPGSTAEYHDKGTEGIFVPTTRSIVFHIQTTSGPYAFVLKNIIDPTENIKSIIGIAAEDIAQGETGYVTVSGGINYGNSQLNAGSTYHIDGMGTITTDTTSFGTIGRALSSNELLINLQRTIESGSLDSDDVMAIVNQASFDASGFSLVTENLVNKVRADRRIQVPHGIQSGVQFGLDDFDGGAGDVLHIYAETLRTYQDSAPAESTRLYLRARNDTADKVAIWTQDDFGLVHTTDGLLENVIWHEGNLNPNRQSQDLDLAGHKLSDIGGANFIDLDNDETTDGTNNNVVINSVQGIYNIIDDNHATAPTGNSFGVWLGKTVDELTDNNALFHIDENGDTLVSGSLEAKEIINGKFIVSFGGTGIYTLSDQYNNWFTSPTNNPPLYLRRGETYLFNIQTTGHPFEIRVENQGIAYNDGVTNNGAESGVVKFKVPMNAPNELYYQCTLHSAMGNKIYILGEPTSLDDIAGFIDSDYIQQRIDFELAVDSDYVEQRFDYNRIIDSDYVQERVDFTPTLDSAEVLQVVTSSELDMNGNKVLFSNVYATETDLPDATTYHGMFAHVHETGAGYFAHNGRWVRLGNFDDISALGLDSAEVEAMIDSDYVKARQEYFDYENIIDAPYVQSRVDFTGYATQQWVGDQGYLTDYDVTEADVTQHQSALSITENQISNLQDYLLVADLDDYATQQWVLQQDFVDGEFNVGYGTPSTTDIDLTTEADARREIFNSWYRFSHDTSGNYPANLTEVNSFQFNEANLNIYSPVNTASIVGFVSPDTYRNYDFSTMLDAQGDTDDDGIGVLLAWATDAEGREHTISLWRATGYNVGVGQSYFVLYNAGQSDAQFIFNGDTLAPHITGSSWSNYSTFVSVTKRGKSFSVACSQFKTGTSSINDIDESTRHDFNLDDFSFGSLFSEKTNYGYIAHSQAYASWTSTVFYGDGVRLYSDLSQFYTFEDDDNLWFPTVEAQPILYLRRGGTYKFNVTSTGHPLQIKHSYDGELYNTGVTNNGTDDGEITFKVPMSAPNKLYYQCTNHPAMGNEIHILREIRSSDIDELIDSDYVQPGVDLTGYATEEWVLQQNFGSGNGNSSGGSGASRVSESETTSLIADGSSSSIQFSTLGKSFALQKVTVNKQCWVRIYSDTASRTADEGRSQGTDPADGSGVIAEFISTTSGTQEFKITPSIMGWLDDSETEVPVAVQNNSGSTGTVQVTIDVLKLES